MLNTKKERLLSYKTHSPVCLKSRILRQFVILWQDDIDKFLQAFDVNALKDHSRKTTPTDCFSKKAFNALTTLLCKKLANENITDDVLPELLEAIIERFVALEFINRELQPQFAANQQVQLGYTNEKIDLIKTAQPYFDQQWPNNIFENPKLFSLACKTGLTQRLIADYEEHVREIFPNGFAGEMLEMVNYGFQDALEHGRFEVADFLFSLVNKQEQFLLLCRSVFLIEYSMHRDNVMEFLWDKCTKENKVEVAKLATKKMDRDNELAINVDNIIGDFSNDLLKFIIHQPDHIVSSDIINLLDDKVKQVWLKSMINHEPLQQHQEIFAALWNSLNDEFKPKLVELMKQSVRNNYLSGNFISSILRCFLTTNEGTDAWFAKQNKTIELILGYHLASEISDLVQPFCTIVNAIHAGDYLTVENTWEALDINIKKRYLPSVFKDVLEHSRQNTFEVMGYFVAQAKKLELNDEISNIAIANSTYPNFKIWLTNFCEDHQFVLDTINENPQNFVPCQNNLCV